MFHILFHFCVFLCAVFFIFCRTAHFCKKNFTFFVHRFKFPKSACFCAFFRIFFARVFDFFFRADPPLGPASNPHQKGASKAKAPTLAAGRGHPLDQPTGSWRRDGVATAHAAGRAPHRRGCLEPNIISFPGFSNWTDFFICFCPGGKVSPACSIDLRTPPKNIFFLCGVDPPSCREEFGCGGGGRVGTTPTPPLFNFLPLWVATHFQRNLLRSPSVSVAIFFRARHPSRSVRPKRLKCSLRTLAP